MFDLASLTLGHEDRFQQVFNNYGLADRYAIKVWWSIWSFMNVRWLAEHGFNPLAPGCEVDVLKSRI